MARRRKKINLKRKLEKELSMKTEFINKRLEEYEILLKIVDKQTYVYSYYKIYI